MSLRHCTGVLNHNALVSHCQHCTVPDPGIAPALLPSLRACLCLHCAGVVTLIAPMLLPASQPSVCPVMMQPQHISIRDVVAALPVALLPYPASFHSDGPLMVWPTQRRCLCQCCAGVLAHIALASLPALHCCHCRRCASVVARASLPLSC